MGRIRALCRATRDHLTSGGLHRGTGPGDNGDHEGPRDMTSSFDAPPDVRALNAAVGKKFFDELTASPAAMTIRHTVQITSFGGSGTTALCNFLAEAGVDVPLTPGQFPFKH